MSRVGPNTISAVMGMIEGATGDKENAGDTRDWGKPAKYSGLNMKFALGEIFHPVEDWLRSSQVQSSPGCLYFKSQGLTRRYERIERSLKPQNVFS